MQVVSRRLFNDQCPTGHLQDRPNAGHAPDLLSPPCLGPTRPKRAQICQRGRRAAAVQICCRSTLSRRHSNTFATSRQERASAAAGIVAGQPAQPPPPGIVTTCGAALTSWDRWSVRAGRQARSPRRCRGTPTARDHRARWRRPTPTPRRRREQRQIWRTLSPLSLGRRLVAELALYLWLYLLLYRKFGHVGFNSLTTLPKRGWSSHSRQPHNFPRRPGISKFLPGIEARGALRRKLLPSRYALCMCSAVAGPARLGLPRQRFCVFFLFWR